MLVAGRGGLLVVGLFSCLMLTLAVACGESLDNPPDPFATVVESDTGWRLGVPEFPLYTSRRQDIWVKSPPLDGCCALISWEWTDPEGQSLTSGPSSIEGERWLRGAVGPTLLPGEYVVRIRSVPGGDILVEGSFTLVPTPTPSSADSASPDSSTR